MGTIITALEEMGLVARKPHPTDGRQVNIELTAKGAAVRKSAGDAKRTWLAQAVSRLAKKNAKRYSRPAKSSSAWWSLDRRKQPTGEGPPRSASSSWRRLRSAQRSTP